MREMLRGLLSSQLGLTDEKAVALIRQKAMALADDLGNPESEAAKKMETFFHVLSERMKTGEAFRQKINAAVSAALLALWRRRGVDFLADIIRKKKEEIAPVAASDLYNRLRVFLSDPEKCRALDRRMLWWLAPYLPKIRDALGAAAEAALADYSGRDMAHIVENGVWHDLQMIRINGSLIGALLGALSFGLFYFVSGGVVL